MAEIRWACLKDAKDLGFVHSESYRNAYRGIIPDEFLKQYTPAARERYFYNAFIQGTDRMAIMLVDDIAVGCLMLKSCNDKDLKKDAAKFPPFISFKTLGRWGLEDNL